MKLQHTPRFKRALKRLPVEIQEKFYKQTKHLRRDLRHPSLRAKKYDEGLDTWQARIDRDVRLYFRIKGSSIVLLDIRHHPK